MRLLPAALLLFVYTANAQWQLQNSHTTASLRGIHSIGNGVAWASGTDGTVLRTVDQGKTWQPCTIPPEAEKLDFRGIQAFNANTAIVMSSGKGDLSRLYKTTDACQTWKLIFTNPDAEGFWDALSFEDFNERMPNHVRAGVLVGDPVRGRFVIFESLDEGKTWRPFDGKHDRAKQDESLFAASNTAAIAVGDAGNLAFVTGGRRGSFFYRENPSGLVLDQWMTGASLSKYTLPFLNSTSSAGAFSISKRRIDDVTFEFMVVGGDYSKPNDPGFAAFLPERTFSFFSEHQRIEPAQTSPHGYRSSVAYDLSHKAWITVGPNGTDISKDDGRNWQALHPGATGIPDEDQNWNAVSLPFVVGPKGRIGLLRPEVLK